MLTVKNLPKGRYEITADNRPLGQFTAEQLSQGLNLSSATADGWEPGGPWDAQAWILKDMTEARSQLASSRRFLDHYLPAHPERDRLHESDADINRHIEELQRTLVKPRAFHFVVRAVEDRFKEPQKSKP